MEFQAVKGTRDFYPEQMRLRNWIIETWRRVSLRNGFAEYDAPIFEYLDLFTVKSGPEIAEQLFGFTDRGGRNLAIRPEITPSLARMVNAKINSLPRPIKWFAVPRLCRAENPQRGRLREFFQWNIDIIGSDDVLADAECVFVCVDFLRELGLTPDDVRVRFGSRPLLTEILRSLGLPEKNLAAALTLLDKRTKIPEDSFVKSLRDSLKDLPVDKIIDFMDSPDFREIKQIEQTPGIEAAQRNLSAFAGCLSQFGIADWCTYDPGIVRGLAYYTGIVYEIFDAGRSLRAVAGGGRYDNLLEVFGGPKTGATGFGMGDAVLELLLEDAGKIPPEIRQASLDFFVIDDGDGLLKKVMELVGALRFKGLAADFSYARRAVGKQLKEANRRGAQKAVMVRADGLAVKNLATGEQTEMPVDEFLANPG